MSSYLVRYDTSVRYGILEGVLKVWRGDGSFTLDEACELNTKHGHELSTMRRRRAPKQRELLLPSGESEQNQLQPRETPIITSIVVLRSKRTIPVRSISGQLC